MNAVDSGSSLEASGAPARTPRIWGFWGTLIWSVVLLAVMLAASIVVVMAYIALSGARGPIDEASLASDGLMVGIGSFGTMIPLVITVWIAIRAARSRFFDYLSFNMPTAKQIALGLVAMALLLPAMDLIASQLGYPITPRVVIDALVNARERGILWFLMLAVLISAPLGEEIVFRGFIFRGLSTSWLGPIGAVIVIAAMFAAIHTQYSAFYLGEVFAIGVVLGAARALSGTVVLPIIMHAFHNAAALAQAYWMSGH